MFVHHILPIRAGTCSTLLPCVKAVKFRSVGHSSSRPFASQTVRVPRVASPSLWHSIVPRFLRDYPNVVPSARSTKWNPATFYIVMFMLIGSNAIQTIALRNDFVNFSRRADAKIGLLKGVLDRIQDGEEVDIGGLLGTGNPVQEKEWEEVLREIADEDTLWQTKLETSTRRTEQRIARDEQHTIEASPSVHLDEAQVNATTQPRSVYSPLNKGQGSDQADGELLAFY